MNRKVLKFESSEDLVSLYASDHYSLEEQKKAPAFTST